jgi:hypothetical protein
MALPHASQGRKSRSVVSACPCRQAHQQLCNTPQQLYKHDRPEEWFVSVTKAFVKALQQEQLAQVTLVRIYATVRHFARWLHRKFPALFPWAVPLMG